MHDSILPSILPIQNNATIDNQVKLHVKIHRNI
jgi:hypothetical protein